MNHYQIIIGNDVWIGARVAVLGGVKIGNGAVIGANSIVVKDIPPYAVAVGTPARIVKYRFDEDTIRKMQVIKWWNWSTDKIWDNVALFEQPEMFIEKFYSPELETFEETELDNKLKAFRKSGGTVYTFVADFNSPLPIWKRVIRGFISAFSDKDPVILVVWTGIGTNKRSVHEIQQFAKSLKSSKSLPNIIIIKSMDECIFSPYTLRQSNYFITTREEINLKCIDWLYDTDVKIISAMDYDIFPNEVPAIWEY